MCSSDLGGVVPELASRDHIRRTVPLLRQVLRESELAAGMLLAVILVSLLVFRVGAGVGQDLRNRLFTNVMGFSNGEMDKFSTASLITRSTNDVQQIQMVSTLLLRMLLYAPVMGVWGIIKVIGTGAHMGWVILLGVLNEEEVLEALINNDVDEIGRAHV